MIDNGNILHQLDPRAVSRIHLVGIAGTGMGSFAGLLKAAGYQVTGSDEKVYPPMSEMLRAWGIPVLTPYRPENLDQARPQLVVVGNVIRRVNPEATAVREGRLPTLSFPAALSEIFLKKRHSIVVAGTHGKTTTSAMISHVLVSAGRDPSFLIGGVALNYQGNFRLGGGQHFVVEGDEYDTAYFDKGPKFLHYRPRTAIFTSLEFDHADIYRDLSHYQSSFEAFVRLLPPSGVLVVSASYPRAVELAKASSAPVITYSGRTDRDADYAVREASFSPEGTRLVVLDHGRALGEIRMPTWGWHNLENALGVVAASSALGLSFEEIQRGLGSFQGVKRRQELRAEVGGVLVVDDFAHHPTAVRETIAAVRHRFPERRIWAVFEPRSNTSRRNIHQEDYARSFTGAARATVKVPERHDQVPLEQELDVPRLLHDLRSFGIEADSASEVSELVTTVAGQARSGDVILAMSNGSFGGFVDKLIAQLNSLREGNRLPAGTFSSGSCRRWPSSLAPNAWELLLQRARLWGSHWR